MVHTYFSPKYSADNQSMGKLSQLQDILKAEGLAEIHDPLEEVGEDEVLERLAEIHSFPYIKAFFTGTLPLAESNGLDWSPQVRDGVLAMNAGMLASARKALGGTEVVANIAQGFHHAHPEKGGGFCTFNGLALTAQANKKKKVFVLDCDEHQGDGTIAFLKKLPNLYNATVYGSSFGADGNTERNFDAKVRGWEQYESALSEAFLQILQVKPDLLIYQAGVDCHISDYGFAGLTTEELAERDSQVFEFAKTMGFPLVFVPAGGYTKHRLESHSNTWRIAKMIYKT